jgi:hypothetical protein
MTASLRLSAIWLFATLLVVPGLSLADKTNYFQIYSTEAFLPSEVMRDHRHQFYSRRVKGGMLVDLFTPMNLQEIQRFLSPKQRMTVYSPAAPLQTSRTAGYFDYPKTVQWMNSLRAKFPKHVHLRNLSKEFNLGTTSQGNQIMALQISKQSQWSSLRPKVLFIGQHHAREIMTHHAVMDLANAFLGHMARHRNLVNQWLEKVDLWFIPVVNPDGLNFVFSTNKWWRKNLTPGPNGSQGVDLNRNYAFKWGECGNFSKSPRSETYLGPKPNSEHEVKVMDQLNQLMKFQYVISFHSYGNEVLYPYRCGELIDKKIYYDLRDRMAKELGYAKRVASSSGEDFEHHFARHGSLSFLLEIGSSFQPSIQEYRQKVRPTVLKLLPFMLQETQKPTLALQVIAQSDQKMLHKTKIDIQGLKGFEGEIRETDRVGVFRRRLPLGEYQITLSKPGFKVKQVKLSVKQQDNPLYQIELEKL